MQPESYHLPAEWEKQEAVWLSWPHNRADWPGKFVPIPFVYAEIIRYLTHYVEVRLLVRDAKQHEAAQGILERAGANLDRVRFFEIPTNRVWLRDSGPFFVRGYPHPDPLPHAGEGVKTLLDWKFSAWAKYPNHKLDNAVPERINAHFPLPRVTPMHNNKRVVLEGGAIDVNGKGAILTTEECLLSEVQCRNPGFTREDYEAVFARYLGISEALWLNRGIAGDDTHGHVDDLARFVNEDTIAIAVERNPEDENYAPLQENVKRLRSTRFTIAELPMPRPLYFEGQRLPASYANFLISNGIVLVPTFNDPADREALSILAQCFPGREVVGIHAVDLVWGLGTLHCMSMQEAE